MGVCAFGPNAQWKSQGHRIRCPEFAYVYDSDLRPYAGLNLRSIWHWGSGWADCGYPQSRAMPWIRNLSWGLCGVSWWFIV